MILKTDNRNLIKSMRKRRSFEDSNYAKPFFKWAGGKSQLLAEFNARLPRDLTDGVLDRYIEPFVGGGAVFFFIVQLIPVREAIICDINKELILTYRVVRKDATCLISLLKALQDEYDSRNDQRREEMYYQVRDSLNAKHEGFSFDRYSDASIERAAELLFLNKTCFNGLFRLNSKGEFNVPFGRYKNPDVVREKNLLMVSELLKNTTIIQGDFYSCLPYIDDKTFVYIDPPYRPLNKSSSFTGYSENGFTDKDQIKLSEFFSEVNKIGAKIMLSNSDPKNEDPDDDFFDILYTQYRRERVMAKRFINSVGEKRGSINELVIMNYEE